MSKTRVEKAITHKKRRRGIFVPLIEDLYAEGVRFDKKDAAFVRSVMEAATQREIERKELKLYGPSSLGECLRRVYFNRHHEVLKIPRVAVPRIDLSQIFLNGDFVHLKIQTLFYKLARAGVIQDFKVEQKVISKHGDNGGTLDIFCNYKGEGYVIDIKGLNVRDFRKAAGGEVVMKYRVQLADYLMLAKRRWPVSKAVLLAENKGGPDNKHPAALTEVIVGPRDMRLVRERLEVLRYHESQDEIPPISCQSTNQVQFNNCPFKDYCKIEVRKVERKSSKSRNAKKYKVVTSRTRVSSST